MRFLLECLFLVATSVICGCAASSPHLSVKLYNPKTGAVEMCAARDSTGREIPILAEVVETCARQLESRGFVRVDNAPEQKPLPPGSPTASRP